MVADAILCALQSFAELRNGQHAIFTVGFYHFQLPTYQQLTVLVSQHLLV